MSLQENDAVEVHLDRVSDVGLSENLEADLMVAGGGGDGGVQGDEGVQDVQDVQGVQGVQGSDVEDGIEEISALPSDMMRSDTMRSDTIPADPMPSEPMSSALGALGKCPFEVRCMIYKYVLDLCSLPKDYVKGQVKKTGDKAIRSGILRTSKAVHAEAIGIVFSTNQFLLYGAQENQDIITDQMDCKYYLRLFLRKTPRVGTYHESDTYSQVGGLCSTEHGNANHIDYIHLQDSLLARIQYLSVYVSTERDDPIRYCLPAGEYRRLRGPAPVLKNLSEHWEDICSFLNRCKVLHHLFLLISLSPFEPSPFEPLPTSALLSFTDDISRIKGVRNLQLFVFFRKCDGKIGPNDRHWRGRCCKDHILSAKYYRHVVKCMGLPKGAETPEFGSGNRIRDTTSTTMEGTGGSLWQMPIEEDGDERLDKAFFGWLWDYGYGRNGESFHDGYRNHLAGRRYECECSGVNVGGLFARPAKTYVAGATRFARDGGEAS